MNKFIKKVVFFALPIAIFIGVIVIIYGSTVPNLSNSISFNAKMLFIKEKEINTELDVLALGSSMTLNNVHSETIAGKFGPKYLSISSWGQSIEQDFKLLKIFALRYRPKNLVISSNFMDFEDKPFKIKFDLLDKYSYKFSPLTGFDLRYNIKIADDYKGHLIEKNSYKYLNFDKYGGINLIGKDLKIDSIRWRGRNIDESEILRKHYSYLDSIARYSQKNDIHFVFVQSPFREGFYYSLNKKQKEILGLHTAKVNSIMEKYGHQYINTMIQVWPDSLFIDYSHLNKKGAEKYTKSFVEQIK